MTHRSSVDCLGIPAEAWANGAGATRTIARGTDAAGDTVWRLSLATLDGAARFSQFPGVDRTFVLVDGDDIELRMQDGELLARVGQPVQFSGDLHVWASLHAAPAKALNVMTQRGICRARVEVAAGQARLQTAGTQFLISLAGTWNLSSPRWSDTLAPLHALRLDESIDAIDSSPADTTPRPLLASIAIEWLSP